MGAAVTITLSARVGPWLRRAAFAVALCATAAAMAQQDKAADRATRRLQLQLQALQSQLQEAQAAKSKADAAREAAEKQAQEQARDTTRTQASLRKATADSKTLEAARNELSATVAKLEQQLAEQKRSGDEALAAKEAELKQALRQRDTQQAQLQTRFDEQVKSTNECTAKNERLVILGAELLDRWHKKGFSDVLRQREPMLGLTEVQMFNLVQDYRDRIDAERVGPVSATR